MRTMGEGEMKVLVIDDSALMRKYLRQILEEEPGTVVETARDGQDGLEKIAGFDPDVVTLDINMPVMDGLTCLSRIMTECPRPVVMISSLTEKGALATLEALELGAVDYVYKPGGTVSLNIREAEAEIRAKVLAAAGASSRHSRSLGERLRHARQAEERPVASGGFQEAGEGLVLIGVSTGGPTTLETILTALPADFPWPVLVAQHMPARFTAVFAERLGRHCALEVCEVSRPTPLERSHIYIGRGDADVTVGIRLRRKVALSVPADSRYLWHPSVERMVSTALEHYPPESLVCVQLTGMGDDGARAMAEVYRRGGRTIAESEESAVVYGMPRALVELGGAGEVLPAGSIAGCLCRWLARPVSRCSA